MSSRSSVDKKPKHPGLLYAMVVVIMLLIGMGIIMSSQVESLEVGYKPKPNSKVKVALVHKDHTPYAPSTSKISTPFEIQLESETGLDPVEAEQPFRLTATVQTTSLQKNVNIEWVIPEGVEVISGSEDYQVDVIGPENTHVSEIVLQAPDYSNYKIHFSAQSKNQDASFSLVKQYNTQEQAQIEALAKELNEKHKKFVKKKIENGEATQKPVF
ncbi:MAG: hypothetical protein CL677_04245 [Bdellovibrionaceae bacterium]|nr:hypothetical protein [Pseudobdellovibrionaceae bacterium]|tara:strand:+ start:67801 stop:68442 length:642 start_codon:yes stop_codon:yes gene_type:complete